jgi:site-specific recombinase
VKDIGASIRSLYSSLLAGITYDGKAVPFFTEEPYVTTPGAYMVLLSVDQDSENNDRRFVNNAIVTIDIVTKGNMKNDRSAVDSIANSVLNALLPDTYVDRDTTDFKVMIRSASSPGYIHAMNGTVHVNRKILRINNHLIQK